MEGLCGFDEKRFYASGLGESQSQPPKRHPSSSWCVIRFVRKQAYLAFLCRLLGYTESRAGEGQIYQSWACLLSTRHVFLMHIQQILRALSTSMSQMPQLGINKYDLMMVMWHEYCHGAVIHTAMDQERLLDEEALQICFAQHQLARKMVAKEKNRQAPKPRNFTKSGSVRKAPLP